jgi:hypothetical protein
MVLEIGNVPYIDSEEKQTNLRGKSARVYVVKAGNSYRIKTTHAVPPAGQFGLEEAIKEAKDFIRAKKGSALKNPVPCWRMGVRGNWEEQPQTYRPKKGEPGYNSGD